ncbi:MAG: hypothetical protein JWN26_94 [Candidatus Saccharibacteria bacterium]|nr:hypothetical protein [Candidatus Saccharibacteria bacterium]
MPEFATDLKTPHHEIAQAGVDSESLLESTRFLTIQAAYDISKKTYEDQTEAAYATAHLVRQTLRFDTYEKRTDWVTADDVSEDQTTNCHGYSIVTSECLDQIGIPHYVGFANQHSFILLQTPNGMRTNLIDTAVKQLYVEIDGAIGEPPLAKQMDDATSAANQLNTDIVLARSEFVDTNAAIYERPWLNFGANKLTTRRYSSSESYDNILMLRSYQPEQGRQILESYANFMLAMRRDAFDTAHDSLQPLDGEYPDTDRRNRFREPSRLVRELARGGRMAHALHDIEVVENSLWATKDIVVHLWPSDQRRRLGILSTHTELIDMAIDEYEAIAEDRKKEGLSVGLVNGRIRKAKDQWARVHRA